MSRIPIYKAEKDLEHLIHASAKVTYASLLSPMEKTGPILTRASDYLKANLAKASVEDLDLYLTKSVLVTSSWNKNDDVFDKAEVWAARHTPTHKPTNLEHDEHILVGHIISNWAINDEGEIIDDDTAIDDVPDTFHICNGAVIYTNWEDKKLIQRTEKLIAEIEKGEKFVSMECLFTNFDYALASEDGKHYIVARSSESAFLTKHLRSYGGDGQYEGYKVGRLLRNITFCGKGYVDRPANPNSIIFDGDTVNFSKASLQNPFLKNNGVFIKCENEQIVNTEKLTSIATENKTMSEEVDKIKAENAKLVAQLEELKAQMVKADVDKVLAENATLKAEVENFKKDKEEEDKKKKEKEAKAAELEAKVEELTKANKEANDKLVAAEEARVIASRVSLLVDGGLDKEVAEAHVKTFANLNEEQFKLVSEALVKAKPAEATTQETEEEDPAEENADAKTLENAQASQEVALTAASSQTSDEENKQETLNKIVAKHLSKKINKNGDK